MTEPSITLRAAGLANIGERILGIADRMRDGNDKADLRGAAMVLRDLGRFYADGPAPPGEVSPDLLKLVKAYGHACTIHGDYDNTREVERTKDALLARLSSAAPTAGGEREPVAGWHHDPADSAKHSLRAGPFRAYVNDDPHEEDAASAWIIETSGDVVHAHGPEIGVAAMLAAEDALAALADAALAVVRPVRR